MRLFYTSRLFKSSRSNLVVGVYATPPPTLKAVVLEGAMLLKVWLRDRRDSLPAMRLRALDAKFGE